MSVLSVQQASRPVAGRPSPAARGRVQGRPIRRAPIDSPWLGTDLIRSGSIVLIGLIGLGACWYGLSGRANYEDEVPWLVGALGSLAVSGCGVIAWLLAGIREVHREMADVMGDVRVKALHEAADEPFDVLGYSVQPVHAPEAIPAGYVTNASMTRVHRQDCQHVQGRVVEQIDVDEIERRGLTYCGVCCG